MVNRVKIFFQLEQDEDGYPGIAAESVWAESGGSGEYILDNIPFFAREATIGDLVAVREEDGCLWFNKTLEKSKNSLIRIVFFDKGRVSTINKCLGEMGCITEYISAKNLLAVSIPGEVNLSDVQRYIQNEANKGAIDFEEPILRQ